MKTIHIFLFTILFSSLLIAQEESIDFEDISNKRKTYQAYIYNFHIDKVGGVTQFLRNNGYPQLDDFGHQIEFRIGSSKKLKKFGPIFSATYYIRSATNAGNFSNQANLTGWSFGFGTEYNLINTENFFIKPMLLLNFSNYTLNLIESANSTSIDQVLNSDYKEYSFKSSQIPVQGGINIGFDFSINNKSIGVILGGGYYLNWLNDNWKLGSNTHVTDKINLSSPYLSAGILSALD